ncbi:hypothetical protein K5X82_10000 [Halosquirtibacter xylanolyticus]|uniref:hypothetical protein n=1 Tax=Halosquirtibacter xylanolyticus TaxID=3374599 RepID=UPI00374A35CE|nr:hypothetical protein K5X82_10000 [Prolixibacteraceae bacterium]
MDRYLQKESLSIVFLGEFNPVILQPYWLKNKELIREEEAKNAKVSVIHNELVKYELDWVGIEVNKHRCEFTTTKSPYFEPLKDLASSVYKILRETPIKSLGINHIYDLALPNAEKYYEFGNILCPLNNWTDSLNDPKLLQLEIFEKERKDNKNGHLRVKIAPSEPKILYGVNFNINDHYMVESGSLGTNLEMVEMLEANWNDSIERAKSIVDDILTKTNLL